MAHFAKLGKGNIVENKYISYEVTSKHQPCSYLLCNYRNTLN
jgi:hypothetical protein